MEIDKAIKLLNEIIGSGKSIALNKQFQDAIVTLLEYVEVAKRIDPTALDRFIESLQAFVDNYIDNFIYRIIEDNDEVAWAVFKAIFNRNQGEIAVAKYADVPQDPDQSMIGINSTAYKWLMEQLDMPGLYDVIKESIKKVVNIG